MTPAELKAIRKDLGWPVSRLAEALGLADPYGNGADKVRKMERGAADISGPIAVAVRCFRDHGEPD